MTFKLLATIVCLLSLICPCLGQKTNAIFFAENGEKFVLHVNGARQNSVPQANVKVEGLQAEAIKVLVVFEVGTVPQLKQLLALEPNRQMTFAIKKNNKGTYVIRVLSVIDIPTHAENFNTPTSKDAPSSAHNTPTKATSTTTTITTPTPTTDTKITTTEGNSLKINVGGNGSNSSANISIEVGGTTTSIQTQTNSTTITATQETTTPVPVQAQPAESPSCASAMSNVDFERAKKTIEAKSFAEEQLTICKQIIQANCLSVTQVSGLLELFTFEEHKLSVAKMAYPKTIDKNNYYRINDLFEFSTSVEELHQFIEKQ